jgi:hypothetical protein
VEREGPRTGLIRLSTNKLIDVDNAIMVHIEATTPLRQAEVTAAKRTIERSLECFDLSPAKLIGDTAYGSAEMLNWLGHQQRIAGVSRYYSGDVGRSGARRPMEQHHARATGNGCGKRADPAPLEASAS